MELACDEAVVKDMDAAGKKAYSNALLACSLPRKMIRVCPLAFGEDGILHLSKCLMEIMGRSLSLRSQRRL